MRKTALLIIGIVTLSSCLHKISKILKANSHENSTVGRILKSDDAEYKYKMAEQFYANKKYNEAQELFEDLFKVYKGTDKYEDMYYKWAYCFYYEKDYANAENTFKTFTETFPNSTKTEECEYMRAYSFYKQSPKVDLDQTNTGRAIALMQAFINTHPTSLRVKDANDIIDKCREKLEDKDFRSAQLYYDLGYFKAAAICFSTVNENYPDSKRSDEYKLQEIKSYYKYAELSTDDKRPERFEKVISECSDFNERFKESKLLSEVNKYKTQANNYLKTIKNEQIKKAS